MNFLIITDPSDFYAVAEEREEMEGPSEGTQRADGGIGLH
jgi:hypothetical protein